MRGGSHMTAPRPKRGRKPIDLSGQKFGHLLVIARTRRRIRSSVVWKCACDCGKAIMASSYSLRHHGKSSCGCARYESRVRAAVAREKKILSRIRRGLSQSQVARDDGVSRQAIHIIVNRAKRRKVVERHAIAGNVASPLIVRKFTKKKD